MLSLRSHWSSLSQLQFFYRNQHITWMVCLIFLWHAWAFLMDFHYEIVIKTSRLLLDSAIWYFRYILFLLHFFYFETDAHIFIIHLTFCWHHVPRHKSSYESMFGIFLKILISLLLNLFSFRTKESYKIGDRDAYNK